jgi:hypothetical protein
MPANLEILENGQVIRVTISDPWTSSEFGPLYQQDREHRDSMQLSHPGEKVHLLVDMTGIKNPSQGFLQARQTPSISHPTAGYIVITGANSMMKSMSEAIMRITRFSRVRFFNTYEVGITFLRKAILDQAKRRTKTA